MWSASIGLHVLSPVVSVYRKLYACIALTSDPCAIYGDQHLLLGIMVVGSVIRLQFFRLGGDVWQESQYQC